MLNRKTVFSIAVAGFIIGVLLVPAAAQQLSANGQQIVNSVTPQQLSAACTKGKDGVTALVRDKIMAMQPSDRRTVQAEGQNIGAVLATKCPK